MIATVPVTAAVDGYPCRGKGAVTLERFTPLRRYEKPLVQKTRDLCSSLQNVQFETLLTQVSNSHPRQKKC